MMSINIPWYGVSVPNRVEKQTKIEYYVCVSNLLQERLKNIRVMMNNCKMLTIKGIESYNHIY